MENLDIIPSCYNSERNSLAEYVAGEHENSFVAH